MGTLLEILSTLFVEVKYLFESGGAVHNDLFTITKKYASPRVTYPSPQVHVVKSIEQSDWRIDTRGSEANIDTEICLAERD